MAGTAFASLLRVFGEIHSNFVQYAPLYVGEGNHRRNPTASSNLALSANKMRPREVSFYIFSLFCSQNGFLATRPFEVYK